MTQWIFGTLDTMLDRGVLALEIVLSTLPLRIVTTLLGNDIAPLFRITLTMDQRIEGTLLIEYAKDPLQIDFALYLGIAQPHRKDVFCVLAYSQLQHSSSMRRHFSTDGHHYDGQEWVLHTIPECTDHQDRYHHDSSDQDRGTFCRSHLLMTGVVLLVR